MAFTLIVTDAIPDAIQSECGPCSEKQKEGAKKVIKFLHDKKPKVWDEVMNKYDPQGTYRAKYEKEYKQFLETGTI